MSVANPIERDDRQRFVTVGAAQSLFGPFDFKIYDPLDVRVDWRATGGDLWTEIDVSVALTGAEPSEFTVTKAGLAEGSQLRIRGQRLHERETDVTRQSVISSAAIEKQLDQITIILQELRRDANLGVAAREAIDSLVLDLIPPDTISESQLANKAVTNPKLADMPANTIKGSVAGGPPEDLTGDKVAKIIVGYTYPLNALNYPGIDNNYGSDCSAGLLALVTQANGNPIFLPRGRYRCDAPIPYSGIVNIGGAGHGSGPGLFSPSGATEIVCNYANPTLFDITTLYACTFRDFRVSVATPYRVPGAGKAISITGDVGNNANSSIYRVAFDNFHTQIYFQRPNWNSIKECYFQNWKNDAVLSETDGTREGSTGWIEGNYFFGNFGDFTGTQQRSAITTRCGYAIIGENEILGGQTGIDVDIANYEAGFVKIKDNTIENHVYYGVRLKVSDASNASMFDITGNEFSNTSVPDDYLSSIYVDDAAARQWLASLTIESNTMRHSKQAALGYIRVAAGANVKVGRNILENVGGTAHSLGIGVVGVNSSLGLGSAPAPTVEDNQFKGLFTNRYAFSSAAPALLRDNAPMTFASIPANCAQGSQIHVSDGRATNFAGQNMTLTNGGTVGHPAFRAAAIWACYGPS